MLARMWLYSPSHPSRVRGLKSFRLLLARLRVVSHPSRVRGLKFALDPDLSFAGCESHPSRVRGLK